MADKHLLAIQKLDITSGTVSCPKCGTVKVENCSEKVEKHEARDVKFMGEGPTTNYKLSLYCNVCKSLLASAVVWNHEVE